VTSDRLETIVWLWSYHDWARPRILTAASRLPDVALQEQDVIAGGLGSGSAFAVLAHIAGAEWLWLERWNGTSPREMPVFQGLDDLSRRWSDVASERRAFLGDLDEQARGDDLIYRRMADSVEESLPLWQTLLHCANHTTLHREDACTALTRLGAPPASVDMIDFMRETRSAGS
jgi:uncharacterized damage-inducible protein DinB